MTKHQWLAGSITGLLVVGIIFSLTRTVILVYNTMVTSKVRVEQRLSDLESVYQRRYALVENLVRMVKETKGFETFQIEVERTLLPALAEAKAGATKLLLSAPQTSSQRVTRETDLTTTLTQFLEKVLVLAPHYPVISDPTLKDRDATFAALRDLKDSLTSLEGDIQGQRQGFNDAVRVYNQNIAIFPANVLATRWGFTPLTGFEVLTPAARQDATITF